MPIHYIFLIEVKMAQIRKVVAINFNGKQDPILLAKLNTVAPYLYRNVHDLTRYILMKFCDEKIRELNLTVDY